MRNSIPDGERFFQEPLSQCSHGRASANVGGQNLPASDVIYHEDEENAWEDIDLTPENVTFVEYLPAGCFGRNSDHQRDEYAVMKFSWEERQAKGQHYFQAGKPTDTQWVMGMWQHTKREDINDLIHNL